MARGDSVLQVRPTAGPADPHHHCRPVAAQLTPKSTT